MRKNKGSGRGRRQKAIAIRRQPATPTSRASQQNEQMMCAVRGGEGVAQVRGRRGEVGF